MFNFQKIYIKESPRNIKQSYLRDLSSESYMDAREFEMDALGFHFPFHIEMFHWQNTRLVIDYLPTHTRNHKFYVDITYRCGVTATLSVI